MENIDILTLASGELIATEKDILTSHVEVRPTLMHLVGHVEYGQKFRLKLPANTRTTPLNVVCSPSGEKFHHIYVDVYPKYDIAYQEVLKKVDLMLLGVDSDMPLCTTEFLEDRLHNKFGIDAFKRYQDAVRTNEDAKQDHVTLFRNIATGCLIHEELRRCDSEGTKFNDALQMIYQSYCDSLDQSPSKKEKICVALGHLDYMLKPSFELVDEIVTWCHNAKQSYHIIDYTRSPTIHVRLCEARLAKASTNGKHISIPDTNQVIYTSALIYSKDKRDTPLNTYEALEEYTYRRGDLARGIKMPSPITQSIVLAPPAVCWTADGKKAVFVFKATDLILNKRHITTAEQEELDRRALAYKQREEERAITERRRSIYLPPDSHGGVKIRDVLLDRRILIPSFFLIVIVISSIVEFLC